MNRCVGTLYDGTPPLARFFGLSLGMHIADVPPSPSIRWEQQRSGNCETYVALTPTSSESLSFDEMEFCDDRLMLVVMKTRGTASGSLVLRTLTDSYGPGDNSTVNRYRYSWSGQNKQVVLEFDPSTQVTTVSALWRVE